MDCSRRDGPQDDLKNAGQASEPAGREEHYQNNGRSDAAPQLNRVIKKIVGDLPESRCRLARAQKALANAGSPIRKMMHGLFLGLMDLEMCHNGSFVKILNVPKANNFCLSERYAHVNYRL